MAEYIKKEDALRQVLLVETRENMFRCIKNIPAADVRPVVRAAWQSWDQDKPPCKWYSCDYCGFHALSKSNYCPNCGAKMIGGDEDV